VGGRRLEWARRWGGLVVALVGIAAYVATLESPAARYQHLTRSYPHHGIIFGRRGTVDLAAVGPSGMASMFNAELFAAALARRGDAPVVVDLSRRFFGVDADYVLLRDLVEQQDVKQVVVQYRRLGGRRYPELYQLGRFADVVESAWSRTDLSILRRLQLAGSDLTQRVTDNVVTRITGGYRSLESGEAVATTADPTEKPYRVVPSRVAAATREHAHTWQTAPGEAWGLDDPEDAHARHYYRKIVALGASHQIPVTFLYLNPLYSPPLGETFRRQAEAFYGVKILALTRSELATVYPRGYADDGHCTAFGQRAQARLFAEKLTLF
jgi:hypothetical protein